jgi:hypothetical protein
MPIKQQNRKFYKKPLIEGLESIDLNTLLYILAYSNRILFLAAKQIALDQNERLVLNTLHTRYLLLIYIQSQFTKYIAHAAIEQNDYTSRKKQHNRLIITNELNRLGLIKHAKNSHSQKLPSYQLTDLGHEAINTIFKIANETFLSYPKQTSKALFPEK